MNRRCLLTLEAFVLATLLSALPNAGGAQEQSVRQTRLDFINAPLADVLRSVASALGLSIIVTDVPADRRASFSSAGPIGRDELVAVLESLLDGNGLVMLQRGSVAQIVPAASAPPPGEVGVGFTLPSPPPLGLISQLVPLTAIRAEEAVEALKRVAPKEARIEAVERNNAVLIIDRGTNVARYIELLRRLDERPQGEAGLATYVVPLKFADADEMAASLGRLFGIAVSSSRTGSLSDRSLSYALGTFRMRELESFEARRDVPVQVNVPPQIVPQATPRDTSAAGAQAPGQLVGRTTIVASVPTNSLIIRTAPPNFPLLRETIEALDTRPPQVLLEVAVAEITLGRGEDFGVNWLARGGSTTARLGNPEIADSANPLGDFVLRIVSLERVDVRAVLRALASRSDVKVLSTPQVLAVNNREARILVGSKVPFVASTRLGDVAVDRSVQYQDVGTNLVIIPTINSEDYVSVEVLQEVSTLTTQTIQAALNAPVISTREAATRAIIRNGQTVVIGGLIGNSLEVRDSGVPFLKDLPLIGFLFKSSSNNRSRSELAIFVTPYIVRTDAEADAIRERVRSRMDSIGTAADSIRRKP